jgi:hypothetical protein
MRKYTAACQGLLRSHSPDFQLVQLAAKAAFAMLTPVIALRAADRVWHHHAHAAVAT